MNPFQRASPIGEGVCPITPELGRSSLPYAGNSPPRRALTIGLAATTDMRFLYTDQRSIRPNHRWSVVCIGDGVDPGVGEKWHGRVGGVECGGSVLKHETILRVWRRRPNGLANPSFLQYCDLVLHLFPHSLLTPSRYSRLLASRCRYAGHVVHLGLDGSHMTCEGKSISGRNEQREEEKDTISDPLRSEPSPTPGPRLPLYDALPHGAEHACS